MFIPEMSMAAAVYFSLPSRQFFLFSSRQQFFIFRRDAAAADVQPRWTSLVHSPLKP
jgi:hypothetical protein